MTVEHNENINNKNTVNMLTDGKTVILGDQLCFKKNFKNITIIASLSFFLC